jgi:excinuclease ABC subunit C
MKRAATNLEFEQAARLRDRLEAVNKAISKQQMVADKNEDLDVIGIAENELEASVQMFYIRKGRVVGRKGFILDKVEDLTPGGLINRILENLYGEKPILGVPKHVLVPYEADDREVYEEWLELARGSRVQIRVPQRGDRVTLLETVTRNAKEEFTRHRMKRASDHNTRSRALTELQDALELPEAPLRIECYDMAHIQGTNYVGSMVVMEDGLPAKREYRRFKVNEVGSVVGGQSDDYAAMAEVVRRRLQAYLDERDRPVSERTGLDGEGVEGKERKPGKFAYPPQLLLVDGGKGQVSATYQVVQELGLADEIPVAGLAKRFEEIYVPGRSEPVELRRGSEALFMLQRIRDEAHRFANTFHRERRSKSMVGSSLDDIAGMGEIRKKKLLKAMGGITKVKQASLEELQAHSFLPNSVAEAIRAKFHSE